MWRTPKLFKNLRAKLVILANFWRENNNRALILYIFGTASKLATVETTF